MNCRVLLQLTAYMHGGRKVIRRRVADRMTRPSRTPSSINNSQPGPWPAGVTDADSAATFNKPASVRILHAPRNSFYVPVVRHPAVPSTRHAAAHTVQSSPVPVAQLLTACRDSIMTRVDLWQIHSITASFDVNVPDAFYVTFSHSCQISRFPLSSV